MKTLHTAGITLLRFTGLLLFLLRSQFSTAQCTPDIQAPTAVCLAELNIALGFSGSVILISDYFDAGSSDNCSLSENLSFSFNPASLNCSHIGTPVNVLMTVTDEAGNSNYCFSTVHVEDKISPTAVCIANVNVALGVSGNLVLSGAIFDGGSNDNCTPSGNLSYAFNPPVLDCSDIGTPINVVVTVTDESGNANSCFSTVNVEDKLAPTPVCLSEVNVALGISGNMMLSGDIFDAGSFDNCTASENLVFSYAPSSLDCSDIGSPVMVMMTVTDESGNSDFCIVTVHVEDKIAPTAVCIANLNVALGISGNFILSAAVLDAGSSDNCTAPENLSFSFNPPVVDCSDIGTPVNVHVTVTDESGNSNYCFTSVHVEDKLHPTIVCKSSSTLTLGSGGILILDPATLLSSSTDNCNLTFSISPPQLDCSDKGNNTITIQATDPGGNSVVCTTNVLILDPRPDNCDIAGPASIICGSTGIIFNAVVTGGNGPFIYDWEVKKGEADGWAITSGLGTSSITMDAGIKKLDLRLTVTDVCGKNRKCSYKITCSSPSIRPKEIYSNASTKQLMKTEISFLKVYPNPAYDVLHISYSKYPENAEIFIVDQSGKIVRNVFNENAAINISNLKQGVYFLYIKESFNSPIIKRFVKLE